MKEVSKNNRKSNNKNKSKDNNKKKSVPKRIQVKKTNQIKGPDLKKINYEVKKESKENVNNHSNKGFYFLIVVFIFLVIIFIGMHVITPKINLVGDSVVEINYNDEYIEKGATAKFFGKDLTSKLIITNNIDISKVGSYQVVYSVDAGIYNIKKERTVKVVDKKKPVIELKGEKEVNVCPNKNFKEIGYKAYDEYDGDLTDKVKVKKSDDSVTYSVKDSSGNSYSINRKINKKDVEKPTITLKGNTTMYLSLEDDFVEPGYTASDNCSGDLTEKVVITGSVKAKVRGTYTLIYQVIDDYNNKITVERKVIVSEKTDPNSGVVKKGTIYLTFDDGPSNITTGAILDILKEERVKATFFVTSNGPDYLIKRIFDEGHTIALHTASHNYSKIYSSVDSYFEDLKIVSDRVKRITGQTSKIVRFPGGSSNTISRRYSQGIMTELSQELFSRGYRYYDWNIDSGDASSSKTKEKVYSSVVNNLSKNKANMVLMHDIKYQTRDALRDIIRYGKENGYSFDRIDMDTYMVRQKINN